MATPYHRLARETPAYAWWKLPVAGVLAVVGYLGAAIALIFTVLIGLSAVGRDGEAITDNWLDASAPLELQEPGFFALTMIGLAIMIPVIILAVLITGPRPVGYLTSVEGRMRWRWLGRTSVLAFAVYGVVLSTALAVSAWVDPGSVRSPDAVDGRVVLLLVLVLLLTPFQAAAEEYVFRGYLLQLVGSWSRFATIPILVSVPVFAAGHDYNVWGLVDVGIFGLTAAYLTVRTGGLEAGIAAHTANNVVLLVVEALGMIDTSEGGGPIDLIPTIVTSVLIVWLVQRSATRLRIARTRPTIEPPSPPEPPMWPPVPYALVRVAPPVLPAPPAWSTQRPAVPMNAPAYPGELPPGWHP